MPVHDVQRIDDAVVDAGVIHEARVVDLEEPFHGERRMLEISRIERALHQQCRPLADHASDGIFGERRPTQLRDQLVR
jgi:hypothetical protein